MSCIFIRVLLIFHVLVAFNSLSLVRVIYFWFYWLSYLNYVSLMLESGCGHLVAVFRRVVSVGLLVRFRAPSSRSIHRSEGAPNWTRTDSLHVPDAISYQDIPLLLVISTRLSGRLA